MTQKINSLIDRHSKPIGAMEVVFGVATMVIGVKRFTNRLKK